MTEYDQSNQGVFDRQVSRRGFLRQGLDYLVLGKLAMLGGAMLARAADVFDRDGSYGAKFNPHDKKYIAAGKCPFLAKELGTLVDHINKNRKEGEKEVTVADLLDGKPGNYEFVLIVFDERDPFNEKTFLRYVGQNKEKGTCCYAGSNRTAIEPEIDKMNIDATVGSMLQEMYSKKDKVQRFAETLESAKWNPNFESLMGFKSKREMRDVLGKTVSVEIRYEPHSPSPERDFVVTYKLKDNAEVVKYVQEFPLTNTLLEREERKKVAAFEEKSRAEKSDKDFKRMLGSSS